MVAPTKSLLDVDFDQMRLPHRVDYLGRKVYPAVIDVANTYAKAVRGSGTGLVAILEPAAIAEPDANVIYGSQNTITIASETHPERPPITLLAGASGLDSPKGVGRIGSLQERFRTSVNVVLGQILAPLYKLFNTGTPVKGERGIIPVLLGLAVPIEDYKRSRAHQAASGSDAAEVDVVAAIAKMLKETWTLRNGTGLLTIEIVGVVPLPQTLGGIVAYCTSPKGEAIPQRANRRLTALDMGGGQFHMGTSTGTKHFSGQLMDQGIIFTAEALKGLAKSKKGITLTYHQACEALHTRKGPEGSGAKPLGDLVDEAFEISRQSQLGEVINAFSQGLRQSQSHGIIFGGSSAFYGKDVISAMPDDLREEVEILPKAQLANALGAYVLLLVHAARTAQQAAQQQAR